VLLSDDDDDEEDEDDDEKEEAFADDEGRTGEQVALPIDGNVPPVIESLASARAEASARKSARGK
jgi:hypothetical protein